MKLLRNGTSIERGTIDRQKRFDYSRRTVSALRNRTLYVYGSGLTAITRYLRPRKLYNRFPNENRRVLGICATESLAKRRQTLGKSAASKSSIEIGSRLVIRGRSRGLTGCFSQIAERKKKNKIDEERSSEQKTILRDVGFYFRFLAALAGSGSVVYGNRRRCLARNLIQRIHKGSARWQREFDQNRAVRSVARVRIRPLSFLFFFRSVANHSSLDAELFHGFPISAFRSDHWAN